MGQAVAPGGVATMFQGDPNCTKGTGTNCNGMHLWGHHWQGKVVHVHSNNEAVVAVVNSSNSRNSQQLHLTRCLFFALAACDVSMHVHHIPGVLNNVADAISSNNISVLFSKVPEADPRQTSVPGELVELLLINQPDWTQPNWRQLFGSCLQLD